jgi:hypothetical protein
VTVPPNELIERPATVASVVMDSETHGPRTVDAEVKAEYRDIGPGFLDDIEIVPAWEYDQVVARVTELEAEKSRLIEPVWREKAKELRRRVTALEEALRAREADLLALRKKCGEVDAWIPPPPALATAGEGDAKRQLKATGDEPLEVVNSGAEAWIAAGEGEAPPMCECGSTIWPHECDYQATEGSQ